jgi:hypothetical protein
MDIITTEAIVPLAVSYLMVRIVMLFASGIQLTNEEGMPDFKLENQYHRPSKSLKLSTLLVVAFVVGMWAFVTGSISAGVYWLLGLNEAVGASFFVVKWILRIAATVAVCLCLIEFCKTWLLKIAHAAHRLFDDPDSLLPPHSALVLKRVRPQH